MILFILLLVFIGIAVALAWFLLAHDHGEKEPIGALWIVTALGLLAGVAAAFLEAWLLNANDLKPAAGTATIAGAALVVGVVEEACKFLPAAFFLYRKRFFNEHTDGIIYFALAGLGFGVPENLLYTLGNYSLGQGAQTGVARIFLTPFFHAAITAMVGYFLVRGKLARKSPWLIGLPLGAAMLLHAIYDFGMVQGSQLLFAVSVLITLTLSAGLFVLFDRAQELDQKDGLGATGHNAFCRSCGFPNSRRHIYCVHCGKIA